MLTTPVVGDESNLTQISRQNLCDLVVSSSSILVDERDQIDSVEICAAYEPLPHLSGNRLCRFCVAADEI
jgi:hypothetical protein